MSHIFISYSRRDLDFAQKIVDALAVNNLDTWIDWKSIPKGEDWEQEIYRGIEEADAFLFLISPDSVASQMCNNEIAHAVKNGKRILPIVLRDTDREIIHPEINKRNWIFCHEGHDDFNKAIEETRKTIHTDYEWLKYHTELQVKALKWEQKKDTSRLLRGKELREAEEQFAEVSAQEDPQPTKIQREYILASQRSEIRTRRQITIGLVTGLAIMIVLSFVAWGQRNEAKSQQATAQAASTQAIRQAEIASSRQYATLSWYYMNERYDLSALFSVEAIKITYTEEAQTVLQNGIKQYTNVRYLPGPINQVSSMSFSKDGGLFAAANCTENLGVSKTYCQESEIRVWELPSRQLVESPISVPGGVARLLITSDGNSLVAGICRWQPDANYCNNEVWTWTIMPVRLTHSPLIVSERYPIYMDINENNLLAIGSCREQQETEAGFQCTQSEVSFFDLVSGQFIYRPMQLNYKMLGSLAFINNDSLILNGCMGLNEIGNGCFSSEIRIIDVQTSATIYGPFRLGIDYVLDILPDDYNNEIYLSACHESEDLGPCAQPNIWRWEIDGGAPFVYWKPNIRPTRLSILDSYGIVVISPNAIQAAPDEEGNSSYLLELSPNEYSGMIFNPWISTAAVFHRSGEILLIDLGWDNFFSDLTVVNEPTTQELIVSACDIAGRNFTQAEWSQYFPDKKYHLTCPQWPAGE